MWDMKNTAMVSGSAQSELQTNKLKIARLPSINCFNKVCDIHHWSLWNKVHFDVVSCVKVVHKSYLAGGLQFFNCRKEAWKWFDGIQTDACQIFFRALLKSKLLQRSFRWEYLKSQWDFRVKIGRLPEAREIMNGQVLLDFSSLLHAYDFSSNCTPLNSITIINTLSSIANQTASLPLAMRFYVKPSNKVYEFFRDVTHTYLKRIL